MIDTHFTAHVTVYPQFGGALSWTQVGPTREDLMKAFADTKKKYPKAEAITFGPIQTRFTYTEEKGFVWKRVKRLKNAYARNSNLSKYFEPK